MREARAQTVATNELFVVGVTLINGVGSARLNARVEVSEYFSTLNHLLLKALLKALLIILPRRSLIESRQWKEEEARRCNPERYN